MILPSHNARQLLNATMSALYRVAYEHDVDFSDVVSVLPSQPSASTAPAARTYPPIPVAVQAEEGSQAASSADLSPSPTVCAEAIPESRTPALAVRAQGRSDVDASSECLSTSLPGAEGVVDRAHHPQSAVDADLQEQEKAIIAETGKSVGEQSPAAPVRSRPATMRAKIIACHAEHPDWPSKLVAEHLGISEDAVRACASRKKLKLVSWWDYQRAQAAKTAEALRTAVQPESPPASKAEPAIEAPAEQPAKPLSLGKRLAAYVAEHPDATTRDAADALDSTLTAVGWAAQKQGITLRKYTFEERSAATRRGMTARIDTPPKPAPEPFDDEPAPVVRRVMKAPTGRFYLRNAAGNFVHQSLQASPTGTGPLMTSDRKWAWYDTMDRYRGAKKVWPELATMRKEAAQP